MKRAAVLTLLAASACIPSEGPMMTPFQDCLGCHRSSGDAKTWTVAGTWAKGSQVSVTDVNGKTVPMTGNQAGNFYTAESLTPPLTVSVDGKVMPDPAVTAQPRPAAKLTYGGCNACHIGPGQLLSFGPDMTPGVDCLNCHGAGGMATTRFSAAGTFPQFPPSTLVSVGGQTARTTAVGNFYITAPIDFSTPKAASVGGSSMGGGTTYGGCNRCHANGQAGD